MQPRYWPALDGLRGLCLLAVLGFHSGLGAVSGGFLGVSTFFTLSGFLITRLLVSSAEASGGGFRTFWSRRFRRLAPAALITIAAVVGTGPAWLDRSQRMGLADDAIAALAYVVNWRFVRAEYAYELLFIDPSPLQHFWSLAIEAQFYLVFPLLVGLLLRRGRGVGTLSAVLLAGTLASVGLSFVPALSADGTFRIYYGSDTRAAEISIGALAALADLRWRGEPWFARRFGGVGALGLVVLVVAWGALRVESPVLYRGGFAVYALFSAAVVLAATRETLVERVLRWPGLVWLGRISYGGYLYHWPIFLLVSADRTGLEGLPLLGVRIALTLAAASASWRWIEEPILRGRKLGGDRRLATWVTVATLGIVVVALVSSPVSLRGRFDRWSVALSGEEDGRGWAVYGDSVALSLAFGVATALDQVAGERTVIGQAENGCGIVEGARYFNNGRWRRVRRKCRDLAKRWGEKARRHRPEIALVLTGAWESRNWRLAEDGPVLGLGDAVFDEHALGAIGEAMDELRGGAAAVVWLTMPELGVPPKVKKRNREALEAVALPGRQRRFNELVRQAASTRDGVYVVDLAGYVARAPGGPFDLDVRHDRMHFTYDAAHRAVLDFVLPEVVARLGPSPATALR